MVRMVPSAVCPAPPRPSEDDDDDFFFDQGAGQVFSTSFHPDMSMVAAAFGDGTVRVYDPLRTEPGPEEGAPRRWRGVFLFRENLAEGRDGAGGAPRH